MHTIVLYLNYELHNKLMVSNSVTIRRNQAGTKEYNKMSKTAKHKHRTFISSYKSLAQDEWPNATFSLLFRRCHNHRRRRRHCCRHTNKCASLNLRGCFSSKNTVLCLDVTVIHYGLTLIKAFSQRVFSVHDITNTLVSQLFSIYCLQQEKFI